MCSYEQPSAPVYLILSVDGMTTKPKVIIEQPWALTERATCGTHDLSVSKIIITMSSKEKYE